MNYSSSDKLTVTVHAGKDSSKDSSEVPKILEMFDFFKIWIKISMDSKISMGPREW